eukprot:CAMPEP_0119375566 /NCGR_PEP_ID=MMETSP1334-20130426/36480_1 /TAXON_ID=127549 /ORGANISM="Calcidiscus leptoporus, Strain RCC1130" /LENGTH=98 /DNA_ID=CAMNT_0007393919 /DNA_START=104 /DNA_END=400 /DNA_ORIENTATION=-
MSVVLLRPRMATSLIVAALGLVVSKVLSSRRAKIIELDEACVVDAAALQGDQQDDSELIDAIPPSCMELDVEISKRTFWEKLVDKELEKTMTRRAAAT